MITLRLCLGLLAILLAGSYVVLVLPGRFLRKPSRPHGDSAIPALLPLAAACLLLISVAFPSNPVLLSMNAAVGAALAGFCIRTLRNEAATVAWFGISYLCVGGCALWVAVMRLHQPGPGLAAGL